jgi:hypothetical protein
LTREFRCKKIIAGYKTKYFNFLKAGVPAEFRISFAIAQDDSLLWGQKGKRNGDS